MNTTQEVPIVREPPRYMVLGPTDRSPCHNAPLAPRPNSTYVCSACQRVCESGD